LAVAQVPLFSFRDFRLLLLGQTTSQVGAQVSGVALPLLAVLTLQAGPLELGLVTASSTVAFALIGLPAGAWLDRVRRRPVLVAGDLIRAVLLATIPLTAAFGGLSITQLVVVSLLSGGARVLFDIGYQSYVPAVIGRDRVLAGNSAMETVRAGGEVVGPAAGGWLVTALGAANVVAVQAVAFAVSAVSLLAIRTPEPAPVRPVDRPNLSAEIVAGLRFVLRNRVLRATALASAASNVAFAIASAVTVIFLARTLSLSATAIGLVLAAGSVSAMLAAALTPRLSRRYGSARIIWLSLAVTGPVNLITPLAQPGWSSVLVVLGPAVGGAGQLVYAITNSSMRQQLCPDRLLSRVTATMRFLIMGCLPLGALAGGGLGEMVGLRVTLWVSGTLLTVAALPVYLTLRGTRDSADLPPWTR
jgi:MFS family permease